MDFFTKRIIILWVMAILVFLSTSAFAEEAKKQQHPIDQFEADCKEKDWSTAGMANATYEARLKWAEEISKYYKLLLNELDDENKAKLIESQRAWVKFRDLEIDLINSVYGKMAGTMWIVISACLKCEIVKQRALDLGEYYFHVMDDKENQVK